MSDQHINSPGTEDTPAKSDEEHVKDLKEAITGLGNAILDLKMKGGDESGEKVENLEHRYTELRNEFEAFEQAERDYAQTLTPETTPAISDTETEAQRDRKIVETLKKQGHESWTLAQQRMNDSFERMKAYVTDPENQEAVKKSTRDMGAAFAGAWSEVARGFDNAFKRLRESRADASDSTTGNAPGDQASDQPSKPKTEDKTGSSHS